MSFYLIYVIFRRAISSSAGQKSLTPPKASMLFTPLATNVVNVYPFSYICDKHWYKKTDQQKDDEETDHVILLF